MIRLRHIARLGPSAAEISGLRAGDEVTFAPMDSLADGLGGLDTTMTRPLGDVVGGSYNYFADGDVLLAKVTPCFENGKKAIARGLKNGVGFATSEVHVIRPDPRKLDAGFLRYLFSSEPFRAEGMRSMTGSGGLRRVSERAILDHRPAVTDLATQKAIAAFLDAETARTDALIEKKERLTKALAEKLASEVDRVILGSLDPAGRPKLDPTSREIWKLKTLCSRLGNGFVGPTRDILVDQDDGEAVPYLQSTHVKNSSIDFLRKPYFVQESWLRENPKARVQKDDLVIVQTGDCGATAIIDGNFAGSGCHAMIITRPIAKRILPRLLLHILSSAYGRGQLAAIQTGALHPHLEVGFVKEIPIPLPPRDMQEAIAREVDKLIEKISDIREKTSESINRLREFRGALITAAVTGQIDPAGSRRRAEVDRRLDAIERNFAWRG